MIVEVQSSCGGKLKASKEPQHFVSPGYPNEYQKNQDCEWDINSDEGYIITLEFDEGFKLPFSPNCTSDRLEIYDGMSFFVYKLNSDLLCYHKCLILIF